MKVDQRALAGIDAKVKRAHQHLQTIQDEMVAWGIVANVANRPWGFVPEVYDGGRKHFYRLRLREPIPVEWAVLLGEALHDLRSALDQCIYWLTVDWSKHPLDDTAFPVYTRKSGFEQIARIGARNSTGWSTTSGLYKIRGVGPGPQAFIKALQPYPQRRATYCFHVRSINDLWNQDKHRLVHLWGIRLSDEKLRLDKTVAADSVLYINRRVLHDGAIAMKVLCASPHPQVNVMGEISPSVAFLLAKRTGGGNKSLWDMYRTIADVIYKLLGAMGHQNDAVNLSVWTAGPSYPNALPVSQ